MDAGKTPTTNLESYPFKMNLENLSMSFAVLAVGMVISNSL